MRTLLSLLFFIFFQFYLIANPSADPKENDLDSEWILSSCDDEPPLITAFSASSCIQFCDGSFTFLANGGQGGGPWDIVVFDNLASVVFTATNVSGPIVVGNLCPGTYLIQTTDVNTACTASGEVFVPPTSPPDLVFPGNVNACNVYILPDIQGFNLTGNEAYYTNIGGTGIIYHPGDEITTSGTLYIYDGSFFCNDEVSFFVNIIDGPILDPITNTTGCGEFILPIINGENLSGNEAYYSEPGGNGDQFLAGDIIPIDFQVYAYDESDGCADEEVLPITILPVPIAIADFIGGGCSGDPFILIGTAIPNGTVTTYQWTGPNGYSSIQQNPSDAVEPGIYTLLVTVDGCSSAPTSVEILFGGNPDVTIEGPTEACAGDLVTLTAMGGIVFDWSNGQNSQSITVVADGSTYSVTATDSNGCFGSATITVNALALPAVGISADIPDCLDGPVSLTATGADTYLWSTNETTTSISVLPSGPSTYSVTGTDAEGCFNTASITLDIPLPPDDPELNCNSFANSVEYTWQAIGAISYTVNVVTGQQGQLAGTTFIIPNLSPGESTSIELIATNAEGCSSSTILECNALICDNPPSLSIDPVDPLCVNDSPVDLEVTISNSDGSGSGSWSGSGITDAQEGIFDPALAGIGIHVISYTFDEGVCSVIEQITIEVNSSLEAPIISCSPDFNSIEFSWLPIDGVIEYTIIVNGGPEINLGTDTNFIANNLAPGDEINVTVTANTNSACGSTNAELTCSTLDCGDLLIIEITEDQVYCASEAIQLEAFANNAVSYTWSPSIFLSCTDCPNPIASPPTTTTFTVTVEDEFGCTNSAEVTLYQEEFPNFSFPNEDYACFGEDYEFCAPDNALSYQWIGPNGFSSTNPCLFLPEMDESLVGVYTLLIEVSSSCILEYQMLVIYELPVEIISPTDTICKGEMVMLSSSIMNAISYEWSPEGAVSCSNCPVVEVRPLANTTFGLTVVTQEGCTYYDEYLITIDDDCIGEPGDNNPTESLTDGGSSNEPSSRNLREEVNIFPNPVKDILSINLEDIAEARIQLFDLNGRLVIPSQISQNRIHEFPVSHLDAGLYLLKISNNQLVKTFKVIITE